MNIAKSILWKNGQIENVIFLNKDGRNINPNDLPFKPNKILVDVECSHDGSFKHILKYINSNNIKGWS